MTAAEAIIVTDAQTRIIRVNPAFTKQSGFSESAVEGHRTSILKSGRQTTAFYQAMWNEINAQGHWAGEICNRGADGHYYTVRCNINAVRDAQGKVIHYAAVQSDVTSLRKIQAQVQHMASYDSLTGLPNRSLFSDRFTQLMASTLRYKRAFALLFIDLDHFKEVNDTLGHSVGDELLVCIARRLQGAVRAEDTVARMGGDEFVVLLPNCDKDTAEQVSNTLLGLLREPITLDKTIHYQPMASVGVAMFPEDGETLDLLLRNADIAMYEAKLSGRNRSTSYNQKMSEEKATLFAIQTELADVVAKKQLRVFYQPKLQLSTGLLVGAEALVRWERPGHGLVSPLEFISIAEKTGQLVEIDRWVMEDALRQVSEWTGQGRWSRSWRISINQNVTDLQRPNLKSELSALLERYQLDAKALELEITEDALLEHTQEVIALLGELTAMGITLAIDDFGTGYSSLSYLRKLPTGVIKIDQSFVRDMLVSDNAHSLIKTIIAMAHGLGHELVAEGVETDAQRAQLLELGCEVGQGYWFGKPVSAQEFALQWLKAS
jgi:diguanylate cyclase (GGDEF)-like protein/PAS domain S-box-containing protein